MNSHADIIARKRTLRALDSYGLCLANQGHTWTVEERLAFDRKVKELKKRKK